MMRKFPCRSAACAVPALERDIAVDERVLELLLARELVVGLQHVGNPTDGPNAAGRRSFSRSTAFADHVLLAEARELLVAHTELLAQHLLGVLAECRRRAGPVARPADMRIGHVGYSWRPTCGWSSGSKKPRARSCGSSSVA